MLVSARGVARSLAVARMLLRSASPQCSTAACPRRPASKHQQTPCATGGCPATRSARRRERLSQRSPGRGGLRSPQQWRRRCLSAQNEREGVDGSAGSITLLGMSERSPTARFLKQEPCIACGRVFFRDVHSRCRLCSPLCKILARVDHKEGPDGCWMWTGRLCREGYGHMDGASSALVHRVAWEAFNGPVPDGLHVMHLCDSRRPPGDASYRRCCNPIHLRLGTHQENIADMVAKGRGRRHDIRLAPPLEDVVVARAAAHHASGSKCHKAKLTEDDVRKIRTLGKSPVEMAREYSVTNSTILAVIRRHTWKCVP